jgi:hypothetical protein
MPLLPRITPTPIEINTPIPLRERIMVRCPEDMVTVMAMEEEEEAGNPEPM